MDELPTPPIRNRRRRIAVLGIFALTAMSAVLGYVLRPRPVPAPRVSAYTPQQAAVAQGHIITFRDALMQPQTSRTLAPVPSDMPRSKASPQRMPQAARVSAPVRIPLTEQDINTVLASNNAMKSILRSKGVQAVQITLSPPNRFMIRAALVVRKRPVNAQIDGRLLPYPPTLVQIVATRVQAGSVLLPPAIVTVQANKIIARFAQKLHGRLPFIVQAVRVTNKTLVLTGKRNSVRGV